ncbi:MAG: DJ-1/PfpI family protein [Puniceicoccales bacterium]|jgi:4-methyl-5(b-hydroxyethyl)-thiazole monophosphate biosynthesis|nr:DJ-1/PfpI family protein [Puniceicoccales bacterium]
MKKRVLIIVADKFEEIEFSCPFDILWRGGTDVSIAGYSNIDLIGANGLQVRANVRFADVISETYDCVILPGGPGCYSLRGDEALGNFLVRHFQSGKLICAICAAPLILHDSGILRGKKYTAHPCTYNELTEAAVTGNAVADGNLITASGPGTAAKFGFKILEHLVDKATADSIAKATLFE